MAEKDIPSFAVDADITPLQGRYFQAVQRRLTDPRLREQAYGLVKQTFGSIQQARDLQRARQQEEQERALNMDVRRAQLEQGKLELGLAREKFRKQQESTATGASIYSAFDSITKDPSLTPQEKASRVYEVAAQNPDFFTDNPAATNRLNFTLGAVAPPRMGASLTPVKEASVAQKLIAGGASQESLRAAGIPVDNPLIKDMLKKKQEEEITKRKALAEDAIKPYKTAIDELKTGEPELDWTDIDLGLRALDELNLVDEKTKKELEKFGVGAFNPEASKFKAKTAEEAINARKNIYSIIQKTVRKAGGSSVTSRPPAPSGFDAGAATQ